MLRYSCLAFHRPRDARGTQERRSALRSRSRQVGRQAIPRPPRCHIYQPLDTRKSLHLADVQAGRFETSVRWECAGEAVPGRLGRCCRGIAFGWGLESESTRYSISRPLRCWNNADFWLEWQLIDLAVHAYQKVGVSLYDTLGPDAVGETSLRDPRDTDTDSRGDAEYIITHANLTIIFASSQHVPTLLALGSRIPKIKVIVSIDELNTQTKNIFSTWGKERGIRVIDFKERELYYFAERT